MCKLYHEAQERPGPSRRLLQSSSILLALGLIGSLAAPTTASAQDATPSQRERADTSIEEVVVTAQRREENLQKVPIAVSVLSSAQIAQQNVVDLRDLNRVAPALSVNGMSSDRNSVNYVIRGFGLASNSGGDPAVITYFAEVPTFVSGPGSLFDLQNIQILKGPQGTLFGRNTTGGAVLIEPRQPGSEFSGYVEGTVGDYDLRRFQGAVDVPLVEDKVLTRFAIDINKRRGFTTDVGPFNNGRHYDDRNYQSYRASLTLRPIEGLENRFIAGFTNIDTNGGGIVVDNVNPNGAALRTFSSLNAVLATQRARGVRKVSYVVPQFNKQEIYTLNNITTYELNDNITLKNIFGYVDFRSRAAQDVVGTPQVIQVMVSPYLDSGAFGFPSSVIKTDELQLQGNALDGRLNWIAGAFMSATDPARLDQQSWNLVFGAGPSVQVNLRRDRSRAVFAQFSYDITDRLKLTVGGRYTKDKKSVTFRSFAGDANGNFLRCSLNPAVQQSNCTVIRNGKFDAPTGNISLDYQVSPDVLVYATARRGYKSGGFNSSSADPAATLFQPEYVTDVEVGVKSQFQIGDMRARVNADIFHADFKDLQESGNFLDPFTGVQQARTINGGKGRIQGGELEATLIPTDNLELSGYLAVLDPKYTENTFQGQDLTGQPFQNTPKLKFGMTGVYTVNLPGDAGDLSFTAIYVYQSKVYFNEQLIPIQLNPRRGQDGYGLVNLRLDWRNVFGHQVDANLFVTNLTDKVYKVQENDAYTSVGISQALYGEPRMWGAGLKYSF